MPEPIKIIWYPDPKLKKVSALVTTFDQPLRDLAAEMFTLMRAERGVGLAAPQVARNIRLFVMNPTGEPQDDRVYVNPMLTDATGDDEGEEGCLSIPDLRINVVRARTLRMQAQDLAGNPVDETADGYIARIWQHETDHLNGIMLTDRMGPVAKIKYRGLLKDLEEKYRNQKGR